MRRLNETTIENGPFKFVKDDRRAKTHGEEVWAVLIPGIDREAVRLTFFCLKNYGGEPNDSSGFTGWRVVSGGPFTRAGGWTSLEAAIEGATPWLIEYYRQDAAEKAAEAAALVHALGLAAKVLGEAS